MEKQPPEQLIKQIVYMIRRLMQAGATYTKELIKHYQVSSPQLYCLVVLHEFGSMPPSQIAKHILVKSSTVTGIVDRLEEKGLVRRVRNNLDRRVINIELTGEGEKLAGNAPPLIQQKIVDGLKKLNQEEVEKVLQGLHILTEMLDVEDVPAEQVPEYIFDDEAAP